MPLIRPHASVFPAKMDINTSIINAFNAKTYIAINVRLVLAHARVVLLPMEGSPLLAYFVSLVTASTVMAIIRNVHNVTQDTIWLMDNVILVRSIASHVFPIRSVPRVLMAISFRQMEDVKLYLPIVYRSIVPPWPPI